MNKPLEKKTIIGDILCIIGVIVWYVFYLGMRYTLGEAAGGYGWVLVGGVILALLRKGFIG